MRRPAPVRGPGAILALGGASGAEIAALEAFRAEPTLDAICVSTFETYGEAEPPPHAIVYFRERMTFRPDDEIYDRGTL